MGARRAGRGRVRALGGHGLGVGAGRDGRRPCDRTGGAAERGVGGAVGLRDAPGGLRLRARFATRGASFAAIARVLRSTVGSAAATVPGTFPARGAQPVAL